MEWILTKDYWPSPLLKGPLLIKGILTLEVDFSVVTTKEICSTILIRSHFLGILSEWEEALQNKDSHTIPLHTVTFFETDLIVCECAKSKCPSKVQFLEENDVWHCPALARKFLEKYSFFCWDAVYAWTKI